MGWITNIYKREENIMCDKLQHRQWIRIKWLTWINYFIVSNLEINLSKNARSVVIYFRQEVDDGLYSKSICAAGGVMVSKLDKQTFTNECETY